MKMKKALAAFIAGAMTLSMLAGCGNKASESKNGEQKKTEASESKDGEQKKTEAPGSKEGKTLVYGSGDYTSINPALYEHGEINSLIFSGITAHDQNDKVTAGLAETWEWDADAKTYTFHLRKGVTFHDGKPFTAEDVKFTLDIIMNPDNGSEIASNYEDITAIDVVDELTVKITLKAPNVAMLDYLTIGILPKHLLEGKDIIKDEFNQAPVGTGPFKLSSWDEGQSITLDKFEDFYLGSPKLDQVVFKIVEDTDARALQLKSGELDLAQITPKAAAQFENTDGFVLDVMKTADYRGILYNFNSKFFSKHKELPNILSYAIDRQSILDSVLLGHGELAYSPLQMGPYNNDQIEKYSFDPQKAKDMLEAAGWKMGSNGFYEKDGEECAFTISNGQADQVRIDMSNICAQNLQEIGVNCKVEVVAETDWANQDAYLIGWGSPFDPDDHTYKVFGTDKGANYNGYSNPKVDELLQSARELETEEERLPLYKEFQTELSKDLPYTFIAYIDAMYVSKDKVTGLTKDTVLGHHGVGIFWNIYDWDIK